MIHNPKLTIIIPVYNEENYLLKILTDLQFLRSDHKAEVVVVDDFSTDNSVKIILENNKLYDQLILNKKNLGKGYCIKKAFDIARNEYVIIQDADNEYFPSDIVKFIKIIDNFRPDLIIGSRFKYSDFTRSHSFWNKFGNFIITNIFNILYNTTFSDLYSCYICFKKDSLDFKKIKTNGFEQKAEILAKIVKKNKIFFEVPINYNGRSLEEGKKMKKKLIITKSLPISKIFR